MQLRLDTTVKEVRENGVVVDEGEFIEAGIVIWASGIKAPDEIAEWGLPQGRAGRIEVEADMRVRGLDDVFAVGDIALSAGVPAAARAARAAGRQARRQADRRGCVAGEQTQPIHYWDKGTLATIGRSSAVAQIKRVPT